MTVRLVGAQCIRSECMSPAYLDGLCRAHWDQERAIRGRWRDDPGPESPKGTNPVPIRPRANTTADERLIPGAFITDGERLYEVHELTETTGFGGAVLRRLLVEDCQTLRVETLELAVVQNRCRLVRTAPQYPDAALAA